jgi:hypothetical protein
MKGKYFDRSKIQDIRNCSALAYDERYSRPNAHVSFYSLVGLAGQFSGYYLAVRELDDKYEYYWCHELATKDQPYAVSFEKVLDNVSNELKEKLLFHLDIFI